MTYNPSNNNHNIKRRKEGKKQFVSIPGGDMPKFTSLRFRLHPTGTIGISTVQTIHRRIKNVSKRKLNLPMDTVRTIYNYRIEDFRLL